MVFIFLYIIVSIFSLEHICAGVGEHDFSGSCYKQLAQTGYDFTAAETYCEGWFADAHLVSLQSTEEITFIQSFKTGVNPILLGLKWRIPDTGFSLCALSDNCQPCIQGMNNFYWSDSSSNLFIQRYYPMVCNNAEQTCFSLDDSEEIMDEECDASTFAVVCKVDLPVCFGIPADRNGTVCGGNGYCIDDDHCLCDAGYYGLGCDVTTCNASIWDAGVHEVWSNDSSVCDNYGVCYPKDVCNWNCWDEEYNSDDVCAGRGVCVARDDCNCTVPGYFGDCSEFMCNGETPDSALVCNNRNGLCVSPDDCRCDRGYGGDFCDSWQCDGIDHDSTSPEPCGGNGDCVGPDECDCNGGYSNRYCDQTTAAYVFQTYGWPVAAGGSAVGIAVCVGAVIVIACLCVLGFYLLQVVRSKQKVGEYDDGLNFDADEEEKPVRRKAEKKQKKSDSKKDGGDDDGGTIIENVPVQSIQQISNNNQQPQIVQQVNQEVKKDPNFPEENINDFEPTQVSIVKEIVPENEERVVEKEEKEEKEIEVEKGDSNVVSYNNEVTKSNNMQVDEKEFEEMEDEDIENSFNEKLESVDDLLDL